MAKFYLLIFLALTPVKSNNGYTPWIKWCVVHDISFRKIKYLIDQSDTLSIIGLLKDNTVICGLPCKAGWIHLTGEWRPKLFNTYIDITYNNVDLPKGSWIADNPEKEYFAVVFPEKTFIKDYYCFGGGGPTGAQTQFYRNGDLYLFFSKGGTTINGFDCKGGILHPIRLYRNGNLKSCTLREDVQINDSTYKKGSLVEFDKTSKSILHE